MVISQLAILAPTEKNVATLSQLPVTSATTTEIFIEKMKTFAGKTLTAPKPQNPVFAGKRYMLTSYLRIKGRIKPLIEIFTGV